VRPPPLLLLLLLLLPGCFDLRLPAEDNDDEGVAW